MARMKKNDCFRFKRFTVNHGRSSMKVGVDAILLACWADVSPAKTILDVGTGCGVLALICAQRSVDALIKGIDIDKDSVEEAESNFVSSPWADRLTAELCDFDSIYDKECNKGHFDLVISNPPFFDSVIDRIETSRMRARHQDSLSPFSLILHSREILAENGLLAMVIPYTRGEEIMECAASAGYSVRRVASVKGRAELEPKRMLLEFIWNQVPGHAGQLDSVNYDKFNVEEIVIEEQINSPTEQFKNLCKDFYLKF